MIDPTVLDFIGYDPATGSFSWLKDYFRHKSGSPAGFKKGHYICLKWKDRHYTAHRFAFYAMTGSFPRGPVDHINGDPMDNRWCNLREVTSAINAQNRKKMPNASGFTGVYRDGPNGRWRSAIGHNGATTYLGHFASPESAHAAYVAAKAALHDPLAIRNIEVLP